MSPWRRRLARVAPFVFVGVLPAALLSIGVARYILNHFFVRAPLLLDSGWYSAIVYRAGLIPANPQIACNYASSYYGVHVSPLVSAFSLLSYLAPMHRIEWYALFQAFVFVPLGIATYVLARGVEPGSALRRVPITTFAALAFCFSGQVIALISYPHYEPAIPGLGCLVIAGLVTGRVRLAWVCLVLAACVREDAGFHTALALAPLWYLSWRGVELRASRRTVISMIAVALAASMVAILAQRLFFHSANLLRAEYFGDPAYAHLSASLLLERVRSFVGWRQVFFYPFVATVIVAAVRRDPRYLLGWAAAAPWFVFNLTAYQYAKSAFVTYTGFPFVVDMFWVYVYGAVLAPPDRRLRAGVLEAVFAVVCVSSTLGLFQSPPGELNYTLRDMAISHRKDRAAVHEYVARLRSHRADFGRLVVDPPMAALALESVGPNDAWTPGIRSVDAIAFHRETYVLDELAPDIFANGLDFCTRLAGTRLAVCTREPLPPETFAGLATEVFPSVFAFSYLDLPSIHVDPRGISLRDRAVVGGKLGRLPRGSYQLSFALASAPSPGDAELARLEILAGKTVVASTAAASGVTRIAIRFDADGRQLVAFHLASGVASELTITSARLAREEP